MGYLLDQKAIKTLSHLLVCNIVDHKNSIIHLTGLETSVNCSTSVLHSNMPLGALKAHML